MSSFGFAPLVESGDLYSCDSPHAFAQDPPNSRRIHLMNQTDLTVISSQNVTISGLPSGFDENGDYAGCNGLTVDPTDGTFYMLLSRNVDHPTVKFNYDRWLATIDPTTGIGNAVGNWGSGVGVTYPFGTIAFNSTGDLHGMINSDIGFPTASQYFHIDKSDATQTLVCDLGIGDVSFQQIAYNYDNDKMYFIQGSEGFPEGEFHTHYNVNAIDTTQPDCLEGTWNGNIGNYEGMGGAEFHFNGVELQGTSYNTNDGLMWALDLFPFGLDSSLNKYDPTNNSTGFVSNTIINMDIISSKIRGLAFALNLVALPDTTPPVISATVSQPITIIEGSSFSPFEFVQCIDDVDGTIVPNGTFEVEETQGVTIDTSVRGTQIQNYYCKDNTDNDVSTDIQYIIKKKSTGGSGGSSSGGTSSSSPSLSSIPTLSVTDTQSQQEDERPSIADLFANLFDNRITEGITTPAPSSSSGSPTQTQTSNPIADFFQNLFSRFFN